MTSNFGGLSDTFEYIEFELDSFDCNQAKNQNYYTTDWPNFFLGKPLNDVAAVKVLEVQIPFTFYLFNTTNNTFVLDEFYSAADHLVTITIPPGNYTSATFPIMLAALLTAASTNATTYTVVYLSAQMILQITSSNTGAGNYFTFQFGADLYDNGRTNPRLWMGFSGGINTSSVGTSQVLLGPSVALLSGPTYLYLNSTTMGSLIHLYLPGNGVVNTATSSADGPQIARIPLNANPGQTIGYCDPNPFMFFDVGNTNFNGSLDFYLTLGTSDFEIPLDLNGAGFSLKLGILTNSQSHQSALGGGVQNDRVTSRTWPTGAYY